MFVEDDDDDENGGLHESGSMMMMRVDDEAKHAFWVAGNLIDEIHDDDNDANDSVRYETILCSCFVQGP